MLDILIVHSDPEVRALLREAAMAVASSLACEEAANSEEARRIASRELPGLAVVEAELPIPHGEQAAGGFPGVQLAASLGPGGRPLPALLVLAGDITKGLLRAVGRLPQYRFFSLDGDSSRDCVEDARRALAFLLAGRVGSVRVRSAREPPVAAHLDLRFVLTDLRCEMLLTGKGYVAPLRRTTPLCVTRQNDFRRMLERIRKYSPITSSGPQRGLQLDKGWNEEIRDWGGQLFATLLNAGLKEPYESALLHCGRLDRLSLHFEIAPDLHDVSIEHLVDNELAEPSFLMLRSPMTRSLATLDAGSGEAPAPETRAARVLCVLSDVFDDTVPRSADAAWEGIRWPALPRMPGLREELACFRELRDELPRLRILPDPDNAEEQRTPLLTLLEKELGSSRKRYDIIHFAGHCHAPPTRDGDQAHAFLMLARPGEPYADPLSIKKFAEWVKEHSARLVFLSACRSMTSATAYAMTAAGIPAVIGFRWDLLDDAAPKLVKKFYKELLGKPHRPIAEALRRAKSEMWEKFGTDPTWAAPLLVTRRERRTDERGPQGRDQPVRKPVGERAGY